MPFGLELHVKPQLKWSEEEVSLKIEGPPFDTNVLYLKIQFYGWRQIFRHMRCFLNTLLILMATAGAFLALVNHLRHF